MSFFSDMRNLLLFLYNSESTSDEEFLTLYESYSSKNPDFPYSAYPKFDYDQIDESECLVEFRVRKQGIVGRCSSNTSHYPRSPKDNLWPNWSTLYASQALLVSMALFRHDSSFCKTSSWSNYDYQYSDGSYIFEPWSSDLTMEFWYTESVNATGICRCYPCKRCTSRQLLWVYWWNSQTNFSPWPTPKNSIQWP